MDVLLNAQKVLALNLALYGTCWCGVKPQCSRQPISRSPKVL